MDRITSRNIPRSLALMMLVALALVVITFSPTPAAVDSCSNLMTNTSLHLLPNTTITSAATASGTFTPPNGAPPIHDLPPFCRVTATLKPSPVSEIKIEVWMPIDRWNQKLQGVGNGGLAGTISYATRYAGLAPAVKSGYASVSTDTGHVATDVTWLPIEDKERDYGYRAIHGMTVIAKVVVQQFYDSAAKRSYFNGCSNGGSEGLGEAQLYPEDYDGILAGAPANFPTRLRAAAIWEFQAADNDPKSNLPNTALSLITTTVLKQCGGQEAAADGFLSDPRTCPFDPEQLLCKSGQDAAFCLSAPQVQAVKKIYGGTFNRRTNQQVWPGLMPGSEEPAGPGIVGWQLAGINGPNPFSPSAQFYSFGVLQIPNVDFHTMDIDAAIQSAEKKFPFINHISTDIDSFTKHTGKLLIYHGWADPEISPLNSINYYGSLVETMGRNRHLDNPGALGETQKSVRLFMVPGMGHCSGGPGLDSFDAIAALDQWVEHGVAPERIIASHIANGARVFSRPLCPYPQEAQYTGSGDRNDTNNWVCAARPFTFDPSFYKVSSAQ